MSAYKKAVILIAKEVYDERSILEYGVRYQIDNPIIEKQSSNCKSKIPIHKAAMGIIILTAIFIIFTTSIGVVSLAPRPGLFNEDCRARSCTKGLHMKCINNTCKCQFNQYYSNGCLNRKNYSEKCSSSLNNCLENINLTCIDGYCKCNDEQYWNGNGCVDKLSQNERCSNNNECLKNTFLNCYRSTKTCNCPSNR